MLREKFMLNQASIIFKEVARKNTEIGRFITIASILHKAFDQKNLE